MLTSSTATGKPRSRRTVLSIEDKCTIIRDANLLVSWAIVFSRHTPSIIYSHKIIYTRCTPYFAEIVSTMVVQVYVLSICVPVLYADLHCTCRNPKMLPVCGGSDNWGRTVISKCSNVMRTYEPINLVVASFPGSPLCVRNYCTRWPLNPHKRRESLICNVAILQTRDRKTLIERGQPQWR